MRFFLIYPYLFAFFEILSDPTILISSCFKMLLLGIFKLRNTYILPPGWCMYLFQPFIWVVMNACSKVNIHFVLFEFVVVVFLLWETMTFYSIIWGPHNGDPMGITLLKLVRARQSFQFFRRKSWFLGNNRPLP